MLERMTKESRENLDRVQRLEKRVDRGESVRNRLRRAVSMERAEALVSLHRVK